MAQIKTGNDSDLLRISMQYFADDGSTGSTGGSTGDSKDSASNNTQSKAEGSDGEKNDSKGNGDHTTIQQMIQSAVDRATNKLGNENKNLKKQLDELMKQKLTDDERTELERKQEREQFEAEKAQFIAEKNKLHAVTALAKADLGVAPEKLDTLVALVMGKDEAAINENVKNLNDVIKTIVADKVAKTFKDSGRNPAGSGASGKDGDDKKNSIAVQLGKKMKEANEKSANVLKYYTGG